MDAKRKRICPVKRAGGLDNRIRRWLQNPRRILEPYIKEGMTVLDLGCGPGFFAVEMAEMVGKSGRVIASDLQEGMLQKLRDKIQGTEAGERIKLHKCEEDKIGISENVDFILAFYMIHEVLNQEELFKEMKSILKPKGQVLIVEPKLLHVSKKAFEETIKRAENIGFELIEKPKGLLGRAVVLIKC
ncbi:class I SAM-dependent methyltransferase [Elusimicrobiota bacterium]